MITYHCGICGSSNNAPLHHTVCQERWPNGLTVGLTGCSPTGLRFTIAAVNNHRVVVTDGRSTTALDRHYIATLTRDICTLKEPAMDLPDTIIRKLIAFAEAESHYDPCSEALALIGGVHSLTDEDEEILDTWVISHPQLHVGTHVRLVNIDETTAYTGTLRCIGNTYVFIETDDHHDVMWPTERVRTTGAAQ